MISSVLQKYIPSKTYVEYLKETGREFTDFEEAGILYHVIADQELKMEELLKLSERTQAAGLKEQLRVWAMYERDSLAMFRDNSAANAVYVVNYADENPGLCLRSAGSAADYETAYVIGLSTKSRFTITKQDMNDAVKYFLGRLTFNSKGRLTDHYFTNKDESTLGVMEGQYPGKMFYNSFIEFPFPFGKGDFVRYVDNSDEEARVNIGWMSAVGIVDESREHYERYLNRDEKKIYVDICNARAGVQFMTEDGSFSNWSVLPVFLERARLDEEVSWYELAMCAQELIAGKGSLDFFLIEYNKLRKSNNE